MPIPDGSTVILRAVVGSTVHGTSVAGTDDRDEMAIAIEPKEYVIGLSHWETTVERTQPEGVRSGPGDLDLVIHSLRKYARLSARGNPTMLLPMFAPATHIISIHPLGQELIDRRSMFLSRQCGKAFLGYMQAQRERLSGDRGSRHGKPRTELVEAYGFDTKYAGHIIRLGYQGIELMETGTLSLPMRESESRDVVDIRTGKWPLNKVLTAAGVMERDLRDLLDISPLPEYPDIDAINHYLETAYSSAWSTAVAADSRKGGDASAERTSPQEIAEPAADERT
jgi:hypothetical protein